jgi:hypothetical protein
MISHAVMSSAPDTCSQVNGLKSMPIQEYLNKTTRKLVLEVVSTFQLHFDGPGYYSSLQEDSPIKITAFERSVAMSLAVFRAITQ